MKMDMTGMWPQRIGWKRIDFFICSVDLDPICLTSYIRFFFNTSSYVISLKHCEKDGIDADEVEIAVERSGDTPVPKWLREKWMPLVDRVIHTATNQGAQMEQNDVGEISVTESKDALRLNNCDLLKAVRLCVENRKKMVSCKIIWNLYAKFAVI